MKQIHINLLDVSPPSHATPLNIDTASDIPRRSLLAKLLIVFFGIGILMTGASVFSSQISEKNESGFHGALSKMNLFGTLLNFSEHVEKQLAGERDGRINVLLLGIGGAGHEGSNLTDTIMIASIDPRNNKVALISLPRDLLVDIPGYGWSKINNAHAYGEAERTGHGPELAEQVISSTFNIPIQYYVRMDFKGFERMVDLVGGVNVFVDNSFTDYTYPTSDKKYQVVRFEQGPQILDGVRALQFARSRHSMMNNEGSDFSRSKRQQKVIMAMSERVMTKQFLLNPQKINDLLSTLNDNISTNMQTWELVKLAQLGKSIQPSSVSTLVFDDAPAGYLHSEITDLGAYVLRPNDGTFEAMGTAMKEILAVKTLSIQQSGNNNTTVIVKNGTQTTGLATKVADELKISGYQITAVGNAENRDMTKNVIYDFTYGKKNDELDNLTTLLHADVIQGTSPEQDANNADVDFLILLGNDTLQSGQ
ncbi:MAG: LCP family protein [Patescibacteria group bacterium]